MESDSGFDIDEWMNDGHVGGGCQFLPTMWGLRGEG